jgi:tetrahydromethanopterin S-methyltransferase subunit A
MVDRIGTGDVAEILDVIGGLPAQCTRGTAGGVTLGPTPIMAGPPARLVLDPAGYFVVLPDRTRGVMIVEHYQNDGTLAHVIEGPRAEHLFTTVIENQLVSRLDHAAYLGKELALAEHAVATGEPYVQDRAPEPLSECGSGCGCHPAPSK